MNSTTAHKEQYSGPTWGRDARARANSWRVSILIQFNSIQLSLQLELDIIKTILVEEIKARAEIEVRTSALGDELKAANLHILEAYRQKEDKEMELNSAKSVIDALESQQIF